MWDGGKLINGKLMLSPLLLKSFKSLLNVITSEIPHNYHLEMIYICVYIYKLKHTSSSISTSQFFFLFESCAIIWMKANAKEP